MWNRKKPVLRRQIWWSKSTDYNELPKKNIKNQLHEFDLIIYSNFINYDYNLDIKKILINLKKISSIKKINPKIMVSDNPKISEFLLITT